MIIDAQEFVPQSRPRLFFVGAPQAHAPREVGLMIPGDADSWRPRALTRAYRALPEALKRRWIRWSMPRPPKRNTCFADLIETEPAGVRWHAQSETLRLLSMMTPVNRAKVEEAKASGRLTIGAMYRRTRRESGASIQRVEIRFDDVAGCLRTPVGGSSRQLLLVVKGAEVRSRLISARETARLMGLDDSYELPERYNDAYHLTGDGVVVDVVKYLAENLLEPHLRRIGAGSERLRSAVASGGTAA
jgi:DNA (cytosine-5)-methyltransferase 1